MIHLARCAINASMLRPYITLPFISNSQSGGAPIVILHQLRHHLFQHMGHSRPMLAKPLAHPLDHPLAHPLATCPHSLTGPHTPSAHPSHHAPTPGHCRMQAAHPFFTPHPNAWPSLFAGHPCSHPSHHDTQPSLCAGHAPTQAWHPSKPGGAPPSRQGTLDLLESSSIYNDS